MALSQKIGFIGAGNMAEAIGRGLVSSGTCAAENIFLFDLREDHLDALTSETGMQKSSSVSDLIAAVDVVVLAVKPQNFSDLAPELKGRLTQDKLAISIMAGVLTQTLEKVFLHVNNMQPRVIRCMPNTPALVGEGVSAIAAGNNASDEDMDIAESVFQAVGIVVPVDELHMDAVTGLTGSGPAYVFRMMESLINAGVRQGLPSDSVPLMVKALVSGAAKLAIESDVEPDELRRRVTSPNGTTQAGLEAMEAAGFDNAVVAAVNEATKRSVELSEN